MVSASLVPVAMYHPPEGMEDYQFYRIEYGSHRCIYEGSIMLPNHVDPNIIEQLLQNVDTYEQVRTLCGNIGGNMRDIKFRAYVYEQGRMSHVNGLYLSGDTVDLDAHDYWSLEEVALMQYTGLRDKNGTEIYEGDVVRILYTDWISQDRWVQGVVTYDTTGYVVDLGEHPMGGRNTGNLEPGKHGWREVMGNIYENPELLEGNDA